MTDYAETEAGAREAWDRGAMEGAATVVYEAYGKEIYSFLLARFHNPSSADDVFSQFTEDFWRGLPQFGWRCSIRVWCYTLARNAASNYSRAPVNRAARRASFNSACLDAFAARVRASTRPPYMRTDIKDGFQRLREQLSFEDRDLLILRVDRDLPWRDVAYAMLGPEQPTDEDTLRKKEAALRQRYVEVKKRLKNLAIESGLLEDHSKLR
jgi:RNA polymerase sigma-70 factor (ECF subfamily)